MNDRRLYPGLLCERGVLPGGMSPTELEADPAVREAGARVAVIDSHSSKAAERPWLILEALVGRELDPACSVLVAGDLDACRAARDAGIDALLVGGEAAHQADAGGDGLEIVEDFPAAVARFAGRL